MAFPTIPTAGRVVTAAQADATNPRGISITGLTKNAGDLLIAVFVGYQSGGTNGACWSGWPAGWTEFLDSGNTVMTIGAAYKWSDGTETGQITATQASPTGHCAMILLSIPGAHPTTPPAANDAVSNTAAAAQSPVVNPAGWDVEDTLWIMVGGSGETATTGSFAGTGTTPPTNYGSLIASAISADVVGGVNAAVAFRQLAAASEGGTNAHIFGATDVSNARNIISLIAVRPAPAGPTIHALAGTIAAASGITGALATTPALAGAVAATSGVTGALGRVLDLAGSVAAVAGAAGTLAVRVVLGGGVWGTDDFDRASLGSDWVTVGGSGLTIIGNQAANASQTGSTDHGVNVAVTSPTPDMFTEATAAVIGSTSFGVTTRMSDTGADTGYLWRYVGGATQLFRAVAGAYTALGTAYSGSVPSGSVLRIEAEGSTIRGYIDGVLRQSVTDAAVTTGSRGGIRLTSANQRADNFRVGSPTPTIAAVTGLTGDLTSAAAVAALAGTIAAVSDVSGAVAVVAALAGTIPATTGASGSVAVTPSLSGTVPATSGATAALRLVARVAGTVAAVSAVPAATLRVFPNLSGSVPATSGGTGTLSAVVALAGSVAASTNVTGALALVARFAGTAAAVSGLLGDLTDPTGPVIAALAGTIAATTGLTGAVAVTPSLSGSVAATTGTSGALRLIARLAGTVAATTGASGALGTIALLSGVVAASTAASGALAVRVLLAGTAAATTAVTGAMRLVARMAGTVPALSGLAGTITDATTTDLPEPHPDRIVHVPRHTRTVVAVAGRGTAATGPPRVTGAGGGDRTTTVSVTP